MSQSSRKRTHRPSPRRLPDVPQNIQPLGGIPEMPATFMVDGNDLLRELRALREPIAEPEVSGFSSFTAKLSNGVARNVLLAVIALGTGVNFLYEKPAKPTPVQVQTPPEVVAELRQVKQELQQLRQELTSTDRPEYREAAENRREMKNLLELIKRQQRKFPEGDGRIRAAMKDKLAELHTWADAECPPETPGVKN